MDKRYECRPLLLLRGSAACTPEGENKEDISAYFAGEASQGSLLGFFFDCSETDEDHDAATGLIRRYTQHGALPVAAGGRIKRLEDVKKYLYAGARAVMFRTDDEAEMSVYQEAEKRFGSRRLALLYHEDASAGQPYVIMREADADLAWSRFRADSDGLLPCIVQDVHTGQVLMMAYMNEEAYNQTLKTGMMNYYSRSRHCQWLKGETSGHYQYLRSLTADCDNDTLLAKVEQTGCACHTGSYSCFFNTLVEDGVEKNSQAVFEDLERVIADRRANPKDGSYTNYLFDKGIDKILKKVGEENAEITIAAKNPDPEELKYETADYLYHLMVLLAEKGIAWSDIMEELARR